MDYWTALKHMKMISIQRKLERYRVIYSWKILENKVPNFGLVTVQNSEQTRNARHFEIKMATGKAGIRNLREQSYQSHGPKLFNAMPAYLRKMTKISQDDFKTELDPRPTTN